MDTDTSYQSFLKYQEAGLVSSKVPKRFWPTLYEKVVSQAFDAGAAFVLSELENTKSAGPKGAPYKVLAKEEISESDNSAIWLIDHGYTFQYRNAVKDQILETPDLQARLTSLMKMDERSTAEEITEELWLWAQTYAFPIEGKMSALWYLLDDFGVNIRHHGDPTFVCVPLFITFYGQAISVLFPRRRVRKGCHLVTSIQLLRFNCPFSFASIVRFNFGQK